MAVVAKGCDSRNIVVHLQEGQVQREQLVILGAPCTGMLDRRKVWERLDGQEPLKVLEDGPQLIVEGNGFKPILGPRGTPPGQLRHLYAPQPGAL